MLSSLFTYHYKNSNFSKVDVTKEKKPKKEEPKIIIEQEFHERGAITDEEESDTEQPDDENKNGHDSDVEEIKQITSSTKKPKKKNVFAEQEL